MTYLLNAGVRGLFDGISGTWLRQMSYSMCRFWAYDESKKLLGAGKDAPAWKLALAGSMGACYRIGVADSLLIVLVTVAGGIAGFVGNPGGMLLLLSEEFTTLIKYWIQRSSWSGFRATLRSHQRSDSTTSTALTLCPAYVPYVDMSCDWILNVL